MVKFLAFVTSLLSFVIVDAQNGGQGYGNSNGGPAPATPIGDYNSIEGYNVPESSKAKEFNNKNLVLNLYQEVFIPKSLARVDNYIDATKYINHNPMAQDGLEPFKAAFTATNGFYMGIPSIRRIATEGDLVWVHTRDNANAYVDIFRVCHGKITEHWDVIQALEPASSNSANSHPFF